MTPDQYQRFTEQLIANADRDSRVIGLVAAGSMAKRDYQPDQYSDHDFYLVVKPGAQPDFRSDLSWLPDAAQIALAFQETEHGMKVLYRSGHLLEFAVFAPEELNLARSNRYRVLLDKGTVAEQMTAVYRHTAAQQENTADSAFLLGQFLTNLLVGVGRHRRGERLSGHKFVKFSALNHLLPLLARHLPSPRAGLLDNLDATRRFEAAYPELGAEINALLLQETETAARGLLALAERELGEGWPEEMGQGIAVIRRFLNAD